MSIRPFALERYFAEHEFSAELLLCSSDVEAYTLHELLALADEETRALWDGLTLGYTETAGHPLLRAEIAALYPGLEADDVLVFAGAQEAIFAFAQAALGEGDHAVVVTPAYQSLHEVARAAGAEVSTVELEHDRGWWLDLDEVRRAVRDDTSAIVVNFPHNPTGAHIDRATLDELVAIAEEAGAHLFSDEVYRWLEHPPAQLLPGAAERSARALSLGVMSKTFALPGLRIGWLACRDRELLQRIAAIKDYTTICSSAPSELLALIALRRRDEVVARSRAIVDANLPLLDDFFARWEGVIEWVRPRGATIGFPRLVADVAVDDFARELVSEEGVLLLPGSIYEHPGNHFRIGFGRRNMPEALARLERFAGTRL
ncbi:MAG TPA: aminotransferase class I/II-fold pyridoxal phosphate-dependent enzyme [Solirubrobacteraceae bacterium]